MRAFLASSALFWLDQYHVDGLRVDAVASMLYLDYARKQGEWIPNHYGGRENLEAIEFLRFLNETVYRDYPGHADHRRGVDRVAAGVAADLPRRPRLRPEVEHGLDARHAATTCKRDPVYRKYHHDELTFRLLYAFNENFVLPLSHDEVVHGKGSLIGKMPGDDWQQFANLRLLFGYMWAHPGKKLLFMGGEFGQRREWTHDASLDWHLLQYPLHEGVQRWVARSQPDVPRQAGAARSSTSRPTASGGCSAATGSRACSRSCAMRRRRGAAGARGVQLHAGAALQLPRRRAARRLLARAPEQRRRDLRRQRPGQLRRRRCAAHALRGRTVTRLP